MHYCPKEPKGPSRNAKISIPMSAFSVEVLVISSMAAAAAAADLDTRTGSLGAARAASWAASLAASLPSFNGATISLLIALNLLILFDLIDFAILLVLRLCLSVF